MAKGKQEQPQKDASKSFSTMEYKTGQRQRQSEADRKLAMEQEGWKPKKTVQEKDRCGACGRPSAAVRRGAQLCTRCQGEPARARGRQKDRDLLKNQPRGSNPNPTLRVGPPLSPLATALSSVTAVVS